MSNSINNNSNIIDNDVRVVTVTANGLCHRIRTNIVTVNNNCNHPSPPLQYQVSQEHRHDDETQSSQQQAQQPRLPLIMLLHGWPDSSFGWRHQLKILAELNYPVCAPDLRGFGGTNPLKEENDAYSYAIEVVARDVMEIAAVVLGVSQQQQMVVIGHDFGAYLAWHLALLYPQIVIGVMALSVPYMGHGPRNMPPMAALQQRFGYCIPNYPKWKKNVNDDSSTIKTTTTMTTTRLDQDKARFHYMLHHNLPNAHEQYDVNPREALYRIYCYHEGVECEDDGDDDNDEQQSSVRISDERMFVPPFYDDPYNKRNNNKTDDLAKSRNEAHLQPQPQQLLDGRSAPPLWKRIPRPKQLPNWLSESDLTIMVQEELRMSDGFATGLRWYQALDMNWHRTRHYLRGQKIQQPCCFLIGSADTLVIDNHGGSLIKIEQQMRQHVVNLKQFRIIQDAGHWLPLQCKDLVNQEIFSFLNLLLQQHNDVTNNGGGGGGIVKDEKPPPVASAALSKL